MKRALLAAACGLSFLAHSAQTHAQNAVTMIVNFSAGGSTDLMARILQPEFAAALGTNMVIKNTSGANGTVGAMEMTRAARDGIQGGKPLGSRRVDGGTCRTACGQKRLELLHRRRLKVRVEPILP